MHLLATGIGDAFSDRFHGSSGLLQAPGGWIAIDCPGMVLGMWRQAAERAGLQINPLEIRDIVITHLHGDHCGGLETIGFLHRYKADPPGPLPRLHAMREVLDRIWEGMAPAMDGSGSTIESYFQLNELVPGKSTEIAGCKVECRPTKHSIPTIGLMFDGPEGCLGWSSDTEFDLDHVQWLQRANCIVHECGQGGNHTTYEQLRSLPEPIQSKLRLIHLPDGFQPPDNELRPLREGEWFSVESSTTAR